MTDAATRAFRKFARDQEFWHSDTADRLEPLFRKLIDAGMSPAEAADMLDGACSALRSEYGD